MAVRKGIAIALIPFVVLGLLLPGVAAAQENVAPITVLEGVERLLYGRPQDGALLTRLNKVEKDVYGEVKVGALITRINTVADFLSHSGETGVALGLQLNAVEWMVYQQLNSKAPLLERVGALELGLLGQVQTGSVVERIQRLVQMVWPSGKLNIERVLIPPKTLVKVQILGRLDSASSRVGDSVEYRVVEDVKIGSRVAIPAGTIGKATVTEVQSAGPVGRAGRIGLDFGVIMAIDGTPVPVRIGERATQENQSATTLAAGASMAGVLLLGPIGLVSGYFVRGKDVTIEANTQFFIEVAEETAVYALSLAPSA
ncbi:MAG: hypothetical protein IMX00_10255 [Limnochordales bacterium]|nr:hypothetical protein [Limnochordales bacterium]